MAYQYSKAGPQHNPIPIVVHVPTAISPYEGPILTGGNVFPWHCSAVSYLQSQMIWRYYDKVADGQPEPLPNEEQVAALARLKSMVDQSIANRHLAKTKTGYAAWKLLLELFCKPDRIRVGTLLSEVSRMAFTGGNSTNYRYTS